MFLVFTLLLLALWVWLFLNVYASFFPFLQSVGHISEYNVAYYSAISAVERGLLVVKVRNQWFVWSWWILAGSGRWPLSDQNLFFITDASQSNWRTVNSRTMSIPASGKGNVDPFLATGDSSQYNALHYVTPNEGNNSFRSYNANENFVLRIDDTTDAENYYSWDWRSIVEYTSGSFSGEIRLPPFVANIFSGGSDQWRLCDNDSSSLCDNDGDGVYDEVKLIWWLHGTYSGHQFNIQPQVDVFYGSGSTHPVLNLTDNAWRASLLNSYPGGMLIEPNEFTLVMNWSSLMWHSVTSPNAAILETIPFETILNGGMYTGLDFSFGLISLLRTFQWKAYPYLEYRLSFPAPVADKYFTIEGHGRNRDYDVEIVIKKPTVPGTIGGDFTVIF